MKKINLLAILILMILNSCSESKDNKSREEGFNSERILKIRECEYCWIGQGMSHCGDCSNPIHNNTISVKVESNLKDYQIGYDFINNKKEELSLYNNGKLIGTFKCEESLHNLLYKYVNDTTK